MQWRHELLLFWPQQIHPRPEDFKDIGKALELLQHNALHFLVADRKSFRAWVESKLIEVPA